MHFVSTIRSLTIAAVLVGTASAASAQAAPGRVAYITARAVLQETPGYAAAESLWVREIDGFRDEITRLQTSLDSSATKFEESSVMLSATKRNDERKKLVDQQAALQRREQELQQRAAARRQELVAPFEQRVSQAIEAVRKEGNFALVFDVSGQTNQIVAADTTLDLTPRVIERIKQATPPAAGGAPRND